MILEYPVPPEKTSTFLPAQSLSYFDSILAYSLAFI